MHDGNLHSRSPKSWIMRANVSQEILAFQDLESHPIVHCDARLPDPFCPSDLFDPQRGMPRILHQESDLLIGEVLNLFGQPLERFLIAASGEDPHLFFFSRRLRKSRSDRYSVTLPDLMSASASRSPFCHSSVQNQACSASISFLGLAMSTWPCTVNSKISPGLRCSFSRAVRGTVT